MMFGYIYKSTDTRNGLIYIGQHISSTFNQYYFGSGRDVTRIPYEERLRYFTVELLHVVEKTDNYENDLKKLDMLETEEIKKHDATNPAIGYNRSNGGQHSAGWYRGTKGRIWIHNENECIRVNPHDIDDYLQHGFQFGLSDSHKQRIADSLHDVIHSEAYIEKQRIAQTGKKRTKATKELMSKIAIERWQRKSFLEKRIGVKIINNGKIERRIRPELAQELVNTGEWSYGRMKMKRHKKGKNNGENNE